MPAVSTGILRSIGTKRCRVNLNTKNIVLKVEEKYDNGDVKPFGEDTVIEVTNYLVGDYWVALYAKIQKATSENDSDGNPKAEYYYKIKCFAPLRSNNRLDHIYCIDEEKMKYLCTKECESYIEHVSSSCDDKGELYSTMEREVINMVEDRSFALDNQEDFKEKLLE